MTHQISQSKREQWIIDYLYGELDETQKRIFEQALSSDEQLHRLYEEHCSVDDLLPKGCAPLINDERMQGVRWATQRAIRSRQEKPSIVKFFASLWQLKVPIQLQVASMAMMFFVGVWMSGDHSFSAQGGVGDKPTPIDGALGFVGEEDYRIVNMQLDGFDSTKGDVQLSFSLAAESRVEGNLANQQIRQLLAQSLRGHSSDQVRLNLTTLLGGYTQNVDVEQALIYTLHNDPNPGVRYNAVEHLVKLVDKDDVRRALEKALKDDVNPGIRVEAFLALTTKLDATLLKILREHCINDANTLIRERSKRILRNNLEITTPRPEAVSI